MRRRARVRRVRLAVALGTLVACAACTAFDGSVQETAEAGAASEAGADANVESSVVGADAGPCVLGAPLLFGSKEPDDGGKDDDVGAGNLDAYGYPTTRAGVGRCLWLYVPSLDEVQPAREVVVGVYADRPGGSTDADPGVLLARGSRASLTTGWNGFALDSPVRVDGPGAFYWIAAGPSSGILRVRNRVPGGACVRGQNTAAVDASSVALPSPWRTAFSRKDQCDLAAYLTE